MKVVTDAVTARLSSLPRVYLKNAVPQSPTYPYSVIAVVPAHATAYALTADHGVRMYRVSVEIYAQTHAAAVARSGDVDGLLLDHRLTVAGLDCTPIRLELPTMALERDPDAEQVVGLFATYTFGTAPTD